MTLQTRFILAGCLLVATTVACGAWSIFTFLRLSSRVNDTLRQSQEAIELTTTLENALEREDDALLLALAGDAGKARTELLAQRQRFDAAYERLQALWTQADEQTAVLALRAHVDAYRRVGDALLRAAGQPGARAQYHVHVNPALRQAVADCAHIRELNSQAMQQSGVRARDEAERAIGVVAAIALASLVLSTLVAVRLARGVVGPVRELTASVDSIRQGDFDRRVPVRGADELGRLAEGFNRMAETLADYRHSSLGELLLSKATLEASLAALPDAVIVVDPDSQVVSANPLARQILSGLGPSSLVGKGAASTSREAPPPHPIPPPPGGRELKIRLDELPLPPEWLDAVRSSLSDRRAVSTRADLSKAVPLALDGRPLKMAFSVAPIPEFLPRRCGAVIVLDDVGDFVRLDELRSELVAVASHELKTPLTTLRMNLLLLQETADTLSPRQRQLLAATLQGGQELAETTDELLDLTRIEAGQLRLTQDRVDLYAVIEQVVGNLRPRYEDAQVELRIERETAVATVRGDAARLRIVFANLLTNALKYTSAGGRVVVRVSSGRNAAGRPGSLLQIAVMDTGSGIPAEFRERVFEKFFRVEHQRSGVVEGVRGAGIGLYLCRQIIEAHGGQIRCEPGEHSIGTRIAISLPVDHA
jgi:NtrC-family two-component system sensor histidine kinase KinB